jgi:hypothetical protein
LNVPAFLLSAFNVDTINNAVTDSGNVPSMPSVALFRTLDENEVQAFRAWARANYTPLTDIKGIWHPIIQDECRQINQEYGRSVRLSPFYAHSAMRNTEPLRRDPETIRVDQPEPPSCTYSTERDLGDMRAISCD